MSYVRRVLHPDESVIYATRLHWLVYARPVCLLAAAVVAAGMATHYGAEFRIGLLAVAGGLLAFAVIDGIAAALRRISTELAVTDHRVIYKRGIVGRYTVEMARSKVESVDVVQSLMGRIFNYGTILVRGTGGTLEPFRDVEDPLRLRSAIIAR